MPDIFDVTDDMRRKIPQIIKEGEDFLDFTKKNFLLIEKQILLASAIQHLETVISMLQTAVIALHLYFINTSSNEAFNQLNLHIQKCELLKKYRDNLELNGMKLDKVQIVKLIEDQVKDEPKILNNLLTYVELCCLTDDDDSNDFDDEC